MFIAILWYCLYFIVWYKCLLLFYDTVCILSYSINVYCYSMILCILSHTCSINVYYYSMIDKAYLNVLVVISKLLGQSILGIRQLPRMNMLVLKKIGCVIQINIYGKRSMSWSQNQNDRKPRNNYFVKIEHLVKLTLYTLQLYIHCNI